jgi:hypothetical protein
LTIYLLCNIYSQTLFIERNSFHMPTPKKKTSGVDVQSIFAQAAQREIPARSARAREDAARERRLKLANETAERARLERSPRIKPLKQK